MMKIVSKLLICLMLVFVFFQSASIVIALEDTEEYTLIEMSEEDNAFYKNYFGLKTVSTISEAYKRQYVFSYDVSEDGRCAMYMDDGTVIVMDKEGIVTNMLKFSENIVKSTNTYSCIRWDGEDLILIHFPRIYGFTLSGETVGIYKYESEYSIIYNPDVITKGDYTYRLENTNALNNFLGGSRHNRLVKINSSDEEQVIFENPKALPFMAVEGIIGFILIFGTPGVVLIHILVISKKNKKHQ